MNKESGNILVIILGIVLILFLVGFFRSNPSFWGTFNYKTILQLPCGITVEHPTFSKNEKVAFPLAVDGYINGCGWAPNGSSAGKVQIFDNQGAAITAPTDLVIPPDSTETPLSFSATLLPTAPPHTDAGNIIFTSNGGLVQSVPVVF